MAITYNKLVIDVNVPISDIVTIKQGDADSRYLDVNLYSNGTPINLTSKSVKIYFLKPDSTAVYTEGEITDATAGRCQFLMSGQSLVVAGTLQAEITIFDGTTEILSTQTFNIYILPSIRDDDAPPSTNEFGVLVTLFQNIQNVMTTINEVLSGFDSLQASSNAAKVSANGAKSAAESYGAATSNKIGNYYDSTSSTLFGSIATSKNSIISRISGGTQTFYSNGNFAVPSNVTKIWVTACAGGQGGWGYSGSYSGYQGGQGGEWIVRRPYSVTSGQSIAITVGSGGIFNYSDSSSAQKPGGNTIIGSLVTLLGGGVSLNTLGGTPASSDSISRDGYASGGTGNGGGGGSLGRGSCNSTKPTFRPGYGGGGYGQSSSSFGSSGNGGNGVVIIEW